MRKPSGTIFIKRKYLAAAAVLLLGILGCLGVTLIPGRTAGKSVTAGAAATGGNNGSGGKTAADGPENTGETGTDTSESAAGEGTKKNYIKWVEFHVTKEALQQAYDYDIQTHGTEHPLDWIELLSYLGAKYGGDFSRYKPGDMEEAAEKLKSGETTMDDMTKDMEYYDYYHEAYGSILSGMVGEYQVQESSAEGAGWVDAYGLKAFHPFAKGFPYQDYDDFGVSRSYGYKRNHLGHDMMAQVGTPVVAVESGYVAMLGWNQYGGWRIGINSFDGRRYYYYAHLRQDFPYAKWLKEGSIVQAGDVIGYVGRTGYSAKENVNNIDMYHLHFGLQLIFDESQREGNNQIWVDVYPLVRFLYQNQSETARDDTTKEWSRIIQTKDPAVQAYEEKQESGKKESGKEESGSQEEETLPQQKEGKKKSRKEKK